MDISAMLFKIILHTATKCFFQSFHDFFPFLPLPFIPHYWIDSSFKIDIICHSTLEIGHHFLSKSETRLEMIWSIMIIFL
jgi:hypothetical protein